MDDVDSNDRLEDDELPPEVDPEGGSPESREPLSAAVVQAGLLIIVVVAVIVGLLEGTAPTGGTFVDIVMSAGFIAAVVAAAAVAGRKPLMWFAVLAFVFVGIQPWLIASAAALALLLLVPLETDDLGRAQLRNAAVGALGIQGVLRFPGLGFTGSASLIAAIAVLPLLVTAWRSLAADRRRVGRRVLMGAAAVAVLGVLVAGISVWWARPSAEAGVEAAEDGLDFARAADQDEAIAELRVAEAYFNDADSTLGAFWAKPARLVPIVAQHARAVETAAEQGAALTRAAAAAASTADIEQVKVSGGRIDLDLLTSVGVELNSTLVTVEEAVRRVDEVSVPWLLPQLGDQIDDVRLELADAQTEIDLAAHAARVVPDMLGASGPKKYLVIFTTPAEARELGGFVGNWSLLEADEGKISLVRSGRIAELEVAAAEAALDGTPVAFADPNSYPDRYNAYRLDLFFQNISGTPDFPTVARAAAEIFPQMGGESIDGLMSVDPYAIAALLKLSGSVVIDGLDTPLGPDNVVDFLLEDQYTAFATLPEREAALGSVAELAFTALLSSDIPGPERLGAVLGPVARQDRLLMTTFDDDANAFLDRVFLRGAFPAPVAGDDFLSVVHDAAVNRKLDPYLTREISYSVLFDPELGSTTSRVTVTLTNNAPDTLDQYVAGELGDLTFGAGTDDESQLPVGHNYARLSVYTSAALTGFRVHGQPAELGSATEYGYNRYLSFLDIAPGQSVTAEFDLQQELSPGAQYRLQIASQPLVNTDQFTVAVASTTDPEAALTESFELIEDINYTVDFALD